MRSLKLKPGREKSLLRRHPWIFSGALAPAEVDATPGETVDILSHEGDFLARAAYSPVSQIRARVWTFRDEPVDPDFLTRRIRSALARRQALHLERASDAQRLIHAESDLLPGLVVDRYGDVLVMQCLTAGVEYWREVLIDILSKETGTTALYERSDADVRSLEGLPARTGLTRGELATSELRITEYGLQFAVDVAHGHKTGFYLDQRENRRLLQDYSQGKDVLNCFSYTGAFGIHALAAGANSLLCVDSSAEALELGRENVRINGLSAERAEWSSADVFQALRKFRDQNRSFDVIVLDPPKFAPTVAQVERASRAYKDINLLAFKLLRPGGILFTFSCSGGVDAALFQKIVAGAALDAGIEASIVQTMRQAADHPVLLSFPEGAYLKGLVCIKD
jgi:23S rRNA (cytosine1962-C5)-methyltransferase